jgi:dienelactone hydrolase
VRLLTLALVALATAVTPAPAPSPASKLELRAPARNPMKYYVSLPRGWTPARRWPAVVVIEDAHREFERTARAFARARGDRPFIIVVPVVLTAGGPANRHREMFPYGSSEWARIALEGDCAFDDQGLKAVTGDVWRRFAAEPQFLITGFEAGGHVVWAQVFRHPERWRAAVVVAPNYLGRCMGPRSFSGNAARATLPITILHGDADPMWRPGAPFVAQTDTARAQARAHGFNAVTERVVRGAGHDPVPAVVLRIFEQDLRGRPHRSGR